MNVSLFKKWWLVTLKGILICAFGAFLLTQPQDTLETLIYIFGIVLLATGASILAFAFYNRNTIVAWKWFLLEGIFDLIFGLLLLNYPTITLFVMAVLGGIWFIVIGALQLRFSLHFRKKMRGWKYPLANGILAVLMGIAIALYPVSGLLFFAVVIGISSLSFGLFLIITSLRMRKHIKQLHS